MIRSLLTLLLLTVSAAAQGFSDASAPYLLSTSSLRKGLVGYWRLEEASGTRYDCSSKGNHLTDSNSVGQAVGKIGNCATFASSANRFLSIPSNSSLQIGSGDWTVTAWVFLNSKLSNMVFAAKDDNIADATSEYWLGYEKATDRCLFQVIGAASYRALSPITLSTGVWAFLQGYYDHTENKAYFRQNDGRGMWTNTVAPLNTTTTPFAIGADVAGAGTSGSYMDGNIDEVGVWNRRLTMAELQQLYNPSASTNIGTLNGSTAWSNNVPSVLSGNVSAIYFNGSSGYDSFAELAIGEDTLVSLWCFPRTVATIQTLVGHSTHPNAYIQIFNSTTIRCQSDTVSTFKDFTVPTITTNTWHNIIVYKGTTGDLHVYLDGTESSSGGQTQTQTTTFNQLARYFDGTFGNWFNGLLSKVEMYDYIDRFTTADLGKLTNGISLYRPKIRFPLNDGSGTTTINTGVNAGSGVGTHFPWAHP